MPVESTRTRSHIKPVALACFAFLLPLSAQAQDALPRPPLMPGFNNRIQSLPELRDGPNIMRSDERERILQGVGVAPQSASPPKLPANGIRVYNSGGTIIRFSTWSPDKKWLINEIQPSQFSDILCDACGDAVYLSFQDSVEDRRHKLPKAASYYFIWSTELKRWRLVDSGNKFVALDQ